MRPEPSVNPRIFQREARIARLHDMLRLIPFVATIIFVSPLIDTLPTLFSDGDSSRHYFGLFIAWGLFIFGIAASNRQLKKYLSERSL